MLTIFQRLVADPRQLFFIDGLGACVSAFVLSMVLANFVPVFGMPLSVLTVLALIPGFFAFYSFGCYFFLNDNWHPFLKGIAVANLLYCCLTIGLVVHHFGKLTVYGVGYFVIEILVVFSLIFLELKTSLDS